MNHIWSGKMGREDVEPFLAGVSDKGYFCMENTIYSDEETKTIDVFIESGPYSKELEDEIKEVYERVCKKG